MDSTHHPTADPPNEGEGPDPTNLLVNYIPTPVTDMDLRRMFEEFGELESARVIVDRVTMHPKGYGFVKFKNASSAERAQRRMDGFQIHNKRLRVGPARGSADKRLRSTAIAIPSYTVEHQFQPPPPPPPPPPQSQSQPPQPSPLPRAPPLSVSHLQPRVVSVQQRAGVAPQQYLVVDGVAVPVVGDNVPALSAPPSTTSVTHSTMGPPSPHISTTATVGTQPGVHMPHGSTTLVHVPMPSGVQPTQPFFSAVPITSHTQLLQTIPADAYYGPTAPTYQQFRPTPGFPTTTTAPNSGSSSQASFDAAQVFYGSFKSRDSP